MDKALIENIKILSDVRLNTKPKIKKKSIFNWNEWIIS